MKADTAQSSAESDALTQKLQRMRAHDARRATADTHDRQLKIWGADAADNPVNGDYDVSTGDVVSDSSFVDYGNNTVDHQLPLPRPHPPNLVVAPTISFNIICSPLSY